LESGCPIKLVGPEKMMDYGDLCAQNHRAKNMLDSRNKILTSNLFGKNFSLAGPLKDKINRVLSGYLKKQEAKIVDQNDSKEEDPKIKEDIVNAEKSPKKIGAGSLIAGFKALGKKVTRIKEKLPLDKIKHLVSNQDYLENLEAYKVHKSDYFRVFGVQKLKNTIDLAFIEKQKVKELLMVIENFLADARISMKKLSHRGGPETKDPLMSQIGSPSMSVDGGSKEGSRASNVAIMMGNESYLNKMSTMGIMKRKPSSFPMGSFFPPPGMIEESSIVIEDVSDQKLNNKSRFGALRRQESQVKESTSKVSYSMSHNLLDIETAAPGQVYQSLNMFDHTAAQLETLESPNPKSLRIKDFKARSQLASKKPNNL
jgi:hypothetical protein